MARSARMMNRPGRRLCVIGTGPDPTCAHFIAEARLAGVPVRAVDLREVVRNGSWRLSGPDDGAGFIGLGDGTRVGLDEVAAVYARPVSLYATEGSPARWGGLLRGLAQWLDGADIPVANRPKAHSHNGSKPFHSRWLRARGFAVPEFIVSSDPLSLTRFAARGRTVCKTSSGVRAITFEIGPSQLADYHPGMGPVHLQRYVEGVDVRIHAVGPRIVALGFHGGGVDYRQDDAVVRPHTCPDALGGRIVAASREMGLLFTGWDFKVDGDGRYWCLECNPMPGYRYYDQFVGGAISRALRETLIG